MHPLPKIIFAAIGSFSLAALLPAQAQIIITEVMSQESTSSKQTYDGDWFELSNIGTAAISTTDLYMSDSSGASQQQQLTYSGTSIAPGQSIVFVEATSSSAEASTETNFETSWFSSTSDVPAGFAIGGFTGTGLSSSGDAVDIYSGNGSTSDTKLAGVSFGDATRGVSFDNSADKTTTGSTNPTLTTLSVAGVNGAFVGYDGETGSPGLVPEPGTYALLLGGVMLLVGFQALRRNKLA